MSEKTIKQLRKYYRKMGYQETQVELQVKQDIKKYKKLSWKEKTIVNKNINQVL